jgi:hypothetical protein
MRMMRVKTANLTSVSQKSNCGTCSSNFALYFPDCKMKANPVMIRRSLSEQQQSKQWEERERERERERVIPINNKITADTAVKNRLRILVVGEI